MDLRPRAWANVNTNLHDMEQLRHNLASLRELANRKMKRRREIASPQTEAASVPVTRRGRAPSIALDTSTFNSSPYSTRTTPNVSTSSLPLGSTNNDLLWTPFRSNRGSTNNSVESLRCSISSQVSDGSIDGTVTALVDLIDDHSKAVSFRAPPKATTERLGYINAVSALRAIVLIHKSSIAAHDRESHQDLSAFHHATICSHTGCHLTSFSKL